MNGKAHVLCSNGHEMKQVGLTRTSRTVEEVVYVKERIKHFNREGSEYWAEVNVPDIVEKTQEMNRIEYSCDECGESAVVEEEAAKKA
ncbi:MAG: hypothetical protein ACE5EO_06380 [Candidatus Krumholzibacteriia bacterium]